MIRIIRRLHRTGATASRLAAPLATSLLLLALQAQSPPAGEGAFMARTRHLDALTRAARHLAASRACAPQLELFAEELRLAQLPLSEITGEFSADDLLGEIFGAFCIGK